MNFGIAIHAGYPPDQLMQIVQRAERLGFTQVWVADEGLYRDPYATLTVAALSTSTIQLGIGVTNPYTRHPALTAAAVATVDELSRGRMVLGLGTGGSGPLALGFDKPRPIDAMRDTTSIVNALTTTGRVDYAGKYYRFRGELDFEPQRRVPIFIGTRGARMLTLAGELADGIILGSLGRPEIIHHAMRHIDTGARRAGREAGSLQLVSWLPTCISSDRALAADAVRSFVAVAVITSRSLVPDIGKTLPTSTQEFLARHGWVRSAVTVDAVKTALTQQHFETFALVGSTELVRARIGELVSLPLAQISVLLTPPPGGSIEEQMEAFGDGVIGRVHA
jgi:5,10-methylenetetrahydromethanopterin reductase